MRVGKAKRRLIKWHRYVATTKSKANPVRGWGTVIHDGQVKAYADVMHAQRYAPIGVREPWYPRWAG